MLDPLLQSGALSITFWAASFAFLVMLRSRLPARQALGKVLSSRLVLVIVALGTFVNLAFALYKGYVDPRDLMQDMVSAQELLAGRSLYPEHLNDKMRDALQKEPPPISLGVLAPALREREEQQRETTATQHWVQAHPPLMSALVAPLVAALGLFGTYTVLVMLSLGALLLTLLLLCRVLEIELARTQVLTLGLAILGWAPVLSVLRSGQCGLLLAALLTIGWYCLRQGRPVGAGVAIGVACCLKMFPALLLVYLLLRQRRAFASALATIFVLVIGVGLVAGWPTYGEHANTARGVVVEYEAYPGNLSLLGVLARTMDHKSDALSGATRGIYYGLSALILAGLTWLLWRSARNGQAGREKLDLEYSLFLVLMPLLSPIAWDHYLVILLLPLTILAVRTLRGTGGTGAVLAFLALAVLFSIPDTTFTWSFELLCPALGWHAGNVLLLSLRSVGLAVLAGWLARFAWPRKEWSPAVTDASFVRGAMPTMLLLAVVLAVALLHVAVHAPSEPWYNGDETRHVMTGVFFHDLYRDLPVGGLRDYTEQYYLQYPALGLLVWPPFFYAVEGAFMLVFGTSFPAAQVLVGLFAVLACVYLYRLVLRSHPPTTAALATSLFALSPLVFTFSHQVMLEVPTVACALGAIFYAQRYLEEERRRDVYLCALFTAATGLTRFDGVVLLPFFGLLLLFHRRWDLLRRRDVLLAVLLTLVLVLPFYAASLHELGSAHALAAGSGTMDSATHFLAPQNFLYYPACIPGQIGWFALGPAAVGLAAAALSRRRSAAPWFALLLATYLTFTPLAELEPRHAIYWVPALAFFAAEGLVLVGCRLSLRPLRVALPVVVVAGTAWLVHRSPVQYVRGYEQAAEHVVAHTECSPLCLFDSYLSGDFIYQVRRHDPDRRLWVLRGDKLFYGVLSDPHAAYQEWATTKEEVLDLIYKYDPEYIVVEEPQVYYHMRLPDLLRSALRESTDRFRLEAVIPVESNARPFRSVKLLIYRSTLRNEKPERRLEIEMLGLGRPLQAPLPLGDTSAQRR